MRSRARSMGPRRTATPRRHWLRAAHRTPPDALATCCRWRTRAAGSCTLRRGRDVVFPQRDHVAVGIGNHGHDAESLLRGLSNEANALLSEAGTEVQQARHFERQAGMAPHHGERVRMLCGVHADMRWRVKKFESERTRLVDGKPEL